MENYYQILGVDKSASQEEIKKRYYFLVKTYHPDRYYNPDDKKAAEEELKKINLAYATLGNENNRKEYDLHSSSTNYNTSTHETANYQENIERILSYIENISNKWAISIKNIDIFNLRSQYFVQLTNLISNIYREDNSIATKVRNDYYTQTCFILEKMALNEIALGLEYESINKSLEYQREQLLEVSTLALVLIIKEYQSKLPIPLKTKKNLQDAINSLPVVTFLCAKELFEYGQGIYAKRDHSYSSSDKKTTPKKNNMGVCATCGCQPPKISTIYKWNNQAFRTAYW